MDHRAYEGPAFAVSDFAHAKCTVQIRTPRERRALIMSAFVILRFDWLTIVCVRCLVTGIGMSAGPCKCGRSQWASALHRVHARRSTHCFGG